MINLTVANIDEFVNDIHKKLANSEYSGELNIYVDKSKIKWGRAQINIVLKANRRTQVYSVYLLESERNGESILPVMVVNNSSIKHNIMYMNSADDSLSKSLEYIVGTITSGFERLHRYSSNRQKYDRNNKRSYKTESVQNDNERCENCDKETCECNK